MATTFLKVEDPNKVRELWDAGLLWRKQLVHVAGEVLPELSPVPRQGHTFFMARWWTDYGYMVED